MDSVNTKQSGSDTTAPRFSLHRDLADNRRSSLQRYRDIVLGRPGFLPLVLHELLILLFGGLPGALGMALRRVFFPLLVGHCGRHVIWGRHLVLRHGHKIRIGDNVMLDDNVVLDAKGESNQGIDIGNDVLLCRGTVLSCKNGNISIGNKVSLGLHCLVHAMEGADVRIGDKCAIASYVYFSGGGTYHLDRLDIPIVDQGTYPQGGIEIAGNVWLGATARILDGVRIASGSVVAAGAVVISDVPANVIVAGVPARIVRQRQEAASQEAGPAA